MLEDIEKTFDTAFFNADHNLKLIRQMLANLDDVVLSSEDVNTSLLVQSIGSVSTQLSTMVFCFAQLMCKTILYSENYFILKEKFQQLQIENFHLKSDKSVMNFVRKLGRICSLDYPTPSRSRSRSRASNCCSPSGLISKSKSPSSGTNQHQQQSEENLSGNSPTNSVPNVEITTSNIPRTKKKKNNKKKKEKRKLNSINKKKKKNCPESSRNIRSMLNESLQHQLLDNNNVGSDDNDNDNCGGGGDTVDTAVTGLEQCFLNNSNRQCLEDNATLRMHRWNNNAFRLIYRNFKEVEVIHCLSSKNLDLQKEIVVLKSKLTNHRLVTRYLNNQLSGRIQQIQLLTRCVDSRTRDKRDSNFEQIWNDLESEILLNKFKTTVQAISQSAASATTTTSATLFDLFHNTNGSNVGSGSILEHSGTGVPTDPNHQQIKCSSLIGNSDDDDDDNLSLSNSVQQVEPPPQPTPVSPHHQRQHRRSIEHSPINNNNNNHINPELKLWKNFRPNWFNFGLFRFVFVQLHSDSKLGISIIGGKEYSLPIMISEIFPDTPAAECGAFRPGDIILSVNFSDLTDASHDQAVHLLQNLCGNCRFGVIYFKPEIDPELSDNVDPIKHSGPTETIQRSRTMSTSVSQKPASGTIAANLWSAFSSNLPNSNSVPNFPAAPPVPTGPNFASFALSSRAATTVPSSSSSSSSSLSLLEISSLCRNYYRSVFNSFLTLPFNFISNYSNLNSSSSSNSSDSSNLESLDSCSDSECSSSSSSFSSSKSLISTSVVIKKPDIGESNSEKIVEKRTRFQVKKNSTATSTGITRKLFPGTATRFGGTMFSNGS